MKLFLSSLLIVSSAGWELPSFMFDGLPLVSSGDQRELDVAATSTLETLLGGTPGNEQTMGPTESPAPSPSPSEVPTQNPTITPQPTRMPSSMPTESPAPSPSPSEIPTSLPSDVPSAGPTIEPTVSFRPSSLPSSSPTDIPSASPSKGPTMGPTVSSAPSDLPSLSPTDLPSFSPSVFPSSSPTFIAPVNASLFMALPIEISRLKPPQIEVVQRVAGYFFQDIVEVAGGALQDVEVTIMNQEAIEIAPDSLPAAMIQQAETLSNGLDLHQALNMTIEVVAYYAGSDSDFKLKEVIEAGLSKDHSLLFKLLSQEDKTFSALALDPGFTDRSFADESDVYFPRRRSRGMSGGAIALATLLAMGAIVLGVAASIFALRSYRTATYGKELISPQSSSSSSIDIFEGVNDAIKPQKSPKKVEEEEPEFDIESMQDSVDNQSQYSATKKGNSRAVYGSRKNDRDSNSFSFNRVLPHQYSGTEVPLVPHHSHSWSTTNTSSLRAKDPPSAVSEVNFGLDARLNTQDKNSMASLFDNDTEFTESTRGRGSYAPDGTLGATATRESSTSYARSFFEGLGVVSPTQRDGVSTTPLGARAVEPDEELQLHEKSSYDNLSTSKRPGLYDVFAPAGPIGIVVDTTKYGPAVHSLKRTSPMLGLINPGDLIVGLDDEDTRGMTAATLTRLMARKSNQKERKITLLTVE